MLMVVRAGWWEGSFYYTLDWMMFENFHYRMLKVGRVKKGSNGTYINDLFMEQSYHNLPSLCDLPVKVSDDSGREEKKEWQTLSPMLCRLLISIGYIGMRIFAYRWMLAQPVFLQNCI